jgi:hypothetical protein
MTKLTKEPTKPMTAKSMLLIDFFKNSGEP